MDEARQATEKRAYETYGTIAHSACLCVRVWAAHSYSRCHTVSFLNRLHVMQTSARPFLMILTHFQASIVLLLIFNRKTQNSRQKNMD